MQTVNPKFTGYKSPFSSGITAMKKHDIRIKYKLSKNMLARWIEPHLEKFEKLGYKKRDRTLTPAQVALFESIFGLSEEADED